MDTNIILFLREIVVVEQEDHGLFGVTHAFEAANNSPGQTFVYLRCEKTGEVRQEFLSALGDSDYYKLFASLAQAKAWIEAQ